MCVACGLWDNAFDNVGCICMHTFWNWQGEHVHQFFFTFTLVHSLPLYTRNFFFFWFRNVVKQIDEVRKLYRQHWAWQTKNHDGIYYMYNIVLYSLLSVNELRASRHHHNHRQQQQQQQQKESKWKWNRRRRRRHTQKKRKEENDQENNTGKILMR